VTPIADFLAVIRRNNLNMDTERRALARRVSDVVIRNSAGRETFDPVLYMLALAEVDRGMDRLYGRFRGDLGARFLQLTLERIRAASALPYRRAVEDMRHRLAGVPEVWAAVKRDAA
jgi:hypothetical protein